ncbi:hypothetical protein [Desulfosarcina ovata]|uniref:hypothetical protein n=1 Tax=Desulfosarcina ovata TaxID=83564 RepID=UPI0012D313C1|nr:hypothetical protein [Desulfosarcina ovata]
MRLPEQEENHILLERKHAEFTFDKVIQFFRQTISAFPDRRIGTNTSYSIEDAALGAFSVFLPKAHPFQFCATSVKKCRTRFYSDVSKWLILTSG